MHSVLDMVSKNSRGFAVLWLRKIPPNNMLRYVPDYVDCKRKIYCTIDKLPPTSLPNSYSTVFEEKNRNQCKQVR